MTGNVNIRDVRQVACHERALRSRMYARVLTFVAFLAVGATIWTDPELRTDATQRVDTLRPVVAELVAGTPLEDWLIVVDGDEASATGLPEISAADAPQLNL